MTQHEAQIWNLAIDAALQEHHKGIIAIRALMIRPTVTVDHIGTTTKQEVKLDEDC